MAGQAAGGERGVRRGGSKLLADLKMYQKNIHKTRRQAGGGFSHKRVLLRCP